MKQISNLTILLVVLLIGCAKGEKQEKTEVTVDIRGHWIADRKYVNEFFGISAEIPDAWHLNKGANDTIEESATEFLAGDDENLKATFKSAIEKTYPVFWAYRYPPGTPGKSNPNVSMIIENVKHLPGIKSASDYLLAVEDTLKMTNKDISFLNDPVAVEVGGAEFWMRETIMPMGILEIRQKFHGKMKDGYILMFGVTVMTEEDDRTVTELTDTIRKSDG